MNLGRTFGRVAEAYERTRPEHAREAIDAVVAALVLPPTATVVDLAAGTGKLTRPLRERFDTVVAVEPDEAMRTYVDGDVRNGTAEDIPLEDASVDAVFVGSAFHWFDHDRAVAELERVLRPRGGLALLDTAWTGYHEEPGLMPSSFEEDLAAVWRRFHDDGAVFPDWRDAFAESRFEPLRGAAFTAVMRISGRDLVDLNLTGSTQTAIPDDERLAIAERAYPLMKPEYELRVRTHAYWTRLR
jgi:SAM-dependent methyltransferase